MMSLRTSDDWTAAVLTIDFGGPAQAWSPAAGESTAYEALAALVAWIAASFPGRSMTWTWSRGATTAAASITLTFDVAASIAANAAAQALTGLPAAGGPAINHVGEWAGTWDPSGVLDLAGWHRIHDGAGAASGVGALRSGVPGLSARAPRCRAEAVPLDVARLLSVLIGAATPREAWIYSEHVETWRLVSVGAATVTEDGPLLAVVDLEVLG